MSRIIELTTSIALCVDGDLTPENFYHHVRTRLRDGFGEALSNHPRAVRLIAVNDPDGDLFQLPYVNPLLAGFGEAAIIWTVDDILDIRPDLTDAQALEVLRQLVHHHDNRHGVTLDDVRLLAASLHGERAPEYDDAAEVVVCR